MEVGLSLGTNEGDRLTMLAEAGRRLRALPGLTELAHAPVYETEPVDVAPAFRSLRYLNTAMVVSWDGDVRELIGQTKAIEAAMGRVRGAAPNLPRPIDIDILYADRLQIDEPGLHIPHPRWAGRSFVVKPLSDIRPDLVLPGSPLTLREMAGCLPDADDVKRYPA